MIFSLLIMGGVAAGLEVGPVQLVNNKRYISYNVGPSPNNSLLECPLQLGQGEELQKITWVLWDGQQKVGVYQWLPTGLGIASGLLEGVVDLSREDEGLELTKLRYDLGGFYSCSATLTDGSVQEAAKWEALIIDTTSNTYFSGGDFNSINCTYTENIRTPAVYPPPTVQSGMYSEEQGGYYDKVTELQWHKFVYSNKSTSYSLQDRIFKIDEDTPLDAKYRFELGVTKTDGTLIRLTEIEGHFAAWEKESCTLPEKGPHQVLRYTGIKNCRNQVTSDFPIKATMTCEEGYHSEGEVTIVHMVCNEETLEWTTESGDHPRLEDLKCVSDDGDDGDSDPGSGDRMVSHAALVVGTLLFLCLFYQ